MEQLVDETQRSLLAEVVRQPHVEHHRVNYFESRRHAQYQHFHGSAIQYFQIENDGELEVRSELQGTNGLNCGS